MQPNSDARLLRDYAEHGAEAAFTEIVNRHINLVYSAALRQVDSPEAAVDIAQKVFIGLARSACSLAPRLATEASLAGWLCRSARNLSLNFRRDEFRRQTRERQAMDQLISIPDAAPDWERLRPVLDAAMSELDETDYDALVLRFFKNLDLRSVGSALGVSDDTAQKRVARALDKLRERLARHGTSSTAAALSVVISANAVQSAPVGLAAAIATAAFAGTSVSTSIAIATTKTIAMTVLQKTIVGAALIAAVGTGVYEAHQATRLYEQNQTLQQQQTALAKQNRELQRQRDDATNQLSGLLAEDAQLQSSSNETELLKLRGEVGVLRSELEAKSQTNHPLAARAVGYNLQQYMPMNEAEKIFTPSSLTNAGLNTPEATIQTYLWTKLLAAHTNSNAFATQKLRESSWFPPGFNPQKYSYAEQYTGPSVGLKFWRIDSIVYSAPDRAEVIIGDYDDSGYYRGTTYNLIHDGQSWKVIAPVVH